MTETLETRFNRHLETYKRDMQEMKEQNEQILLILKPMSEVFNGISFTSKWTINTLKFLGLVGAGVGALIYLAKLLK